MRTDYWQASLSRRLSRRRALITTGTAAAVAALLAACGGGTGSKDVGPIDKSGLLAQPVDTSKQAKRGGTLKRSTGSDPAGLDPHGGGASVASFYEIAYDRLFNYKSGYMEPSKSEFEGALAESWEWSPDRLQITAKLRPGVKFHNLAPINGRAMDVDDVKFSWQRFSALGSNRTVVANSANPDAPVLSVTAPDSRTIVIKFTKPIVYAQAYMTQRGYLSVVPKEAENAQILDLRNKMIGTGPVFLSDYQPSIGLTFKRNPDYWGDKTRSYIEQVDYPIITEAATGLAQFRAGNVHNYGVRQEDILITKKDVPALSMFERDFTVETRRTVFGWETPALRDKRVRQALSMTMGRDDWIDAQYNTDTFRSQGLDIETRWNTALTGGENNTGWWLNPKGKDFGPNAKYFNKDIAEAKKLLAAAGFADLELTSNHFTTTENGVDYVKFIDLFESMAGEAGVKFKKNLFPYSDYLRLYRDTQGKYTGLAFKLGPGSPSDDPISQLTYEFSKEGGVGYHGFDLAGKGDGSGDPYVEDQLAKGRVEFDTEARRKIVLDLQRYLAEQVYTLRWPGGATGFDLIWPAVANYRVFRAGPSTTNVVALTTWWIDETKPPYVKT